MRPITQRLAYLPLLVLVGACAESDTAPTDESRTASSELIQITDAENCVTLYAGQTINVGTVCVEVDNSVDTSASCGDGASGALVVTYKTDGGWELVETHFAGGDSLDDIPTNRRGNPQIGRFPYHSGDIKGETTYSFEVPLCDFGLDAGDTVCDPVTAFLAAHAVVRKPTGDGGFQEETGWGDGDRFLRLGSWAEYFTLTLECYDDPEPPEPPGPMECETAFANGGDDATCFLDLDMDGDGSGDFSRWGWSNGPIGPGSYSWEVYAAAGRCDTWRGTVVGTLDVEYDGMTATVSFKSVDGFVLEEEHLFIGREPVPRDGRGEHTVAPGQYPYTADLDDADATSWTVDGLSGDIYIVYHAVSCTAF